MDGTERIRIIAKIVQRADSKGLLIFDRISLMMDLECVANEFELRLEELLNADDYKFTHDICGIQNNLNRETKKMDNMFIPQCAR